MRAIVSCSRIVLFAGGLFSASSVLAQHGGGHGGGGGFPAGPGVSGGSSYYPGGFRGDTGGFRGVPGHPPDSAGTTGGLHGGRQLGPPGRWWDDKHFVKDLKLRPDQQRRMDAAFEENRAGLLRHYEILQGEEARLAGLTRAMPLDQQALYTQIDRVAQARAELEKANTHLQLQLRSEMDADQVMRLEQHR